MPQAPALRVLSVLLIVFLAGASTLAPQAATPAAAQAAPTLDGPVTDLAGTLTGDERQEALDAIQDLRDGQNVQLFALFVDTTQGTPAPAYAEEVAEANGLGGNDAVLVVAMEDRRYAIWVGPLLDEVSDEELDSILAQRVEPRLAGGEFGQAVAEAARGLGQAQGGSLTQGPEGDEGGGSGAWNTFIVLVVILVVAGGGLLVWQISRPPKEPREGAPATPQMPLDALARHANSLLIETDEDLRQNQQELAFAEAQFGEEEVRPFREALASASASMREAFGLRQQLDDADPETDEEQRGILDEIVRRCEEAQAVMDAQREHFQALRDLQRNAPELLERIPGEIGRVGQRLGETEALLVRIRTEAPTSAASVAGNLEEARKRLAAANELVTAGHDELRQDRRPGAARSIKAAQDLVAQAASLLDAVHLLHEQLEEARGRAEALRAEVDSDLRAARSMLAERPDGALESRVEAIATTLAGDSGDALVEYQRLQEADEAANEVLAAATEGVEQRRREEAALRHALHSAELEVDRAESYIAGRRHGVGRVPRTRLTEARRALEDAHARSAEDPPGALKAAQRARQLATQASDAARREFDDYDERFGGGFPGGGRSRDRWGGDIGSVLIGTVIGSVLSGGGGGRGGGGRRGGGGIGGFGGRSRGGGFGGGGGRSRGGAW